MTQSLNQTVNDDFDKFDGAWPRMCLSKR